jgi:hypothetical protein
MCINDELRIVKNFLCHMSKVYRQRYQNWVVVQHILMAGTSTAGATSCVEKCRELGIDPYSHSLEEEEA